MFELKCHMIKRDFVIAKNKSRERNMLQGIEPIAFGGVNCYLLTTEKGFVLIDTGFSKKRVDVEKELESVC